MPKETILIVEDEEDIRELLLFTLQKAGYEVLSAESGEEGLKLAESKTPSLILLDIMLPGLDGLEVCKRLRANADTNAIPVIMLTAKSEEVDIVLGLEIGANDYVTKPFSPRILEARVRAHLRKTPAENTSMIQFPGLQIDPERFEAKVDGKSVSLTATEFNLLYLLAKSAGRVFTRQNIVDKTQRSRLRCHGAID